MKTDITLKAGKTQTNNIAYNVSTALINFRINQ